MLFKIQDVIQVCVNANLRTMFNILSMQKQIELDTKTNNASTI
jgi:hypothetical protein